MKCPKCASDNRVSSKFCGRCGAALPQPGPGNARKPGPAPLSAAAGSGKSPAPNPLWQPTWRWHIRTLLIIYAVLAAVYLVVNRILSIVPEPYRMRDIPKEMTPWLKR